MCMSGLPEGVPRFVVRGANIFSLAFSCCPHAIRNARREWAATPACLILRIVGGKPDDLAVAAFTFGHPLDRRGVNAADGEIQRDAAEYLYAGHLLTNDVGE